MRRLNTTVRGEVSAVAKPFTLDNLMLALRIKAYAAGHLLPTLQVYQSAEFIADAIRAYGLADVIAGRHDGRPVTFARGFELVFGERLRA